jgi:DNA repair protein RadC
MEKQNRIRDTNLCNLNNNELLAMVLSSDKVQYCSLEQSSRIIQACENNLQMLYTTPVPELHQRLGLTLADSYRLKAMFELTNRRQSSAVIQRQKISNPADVYSLFSNLQEKPFEEFWIILLNKANRIIDTVKISEGGVSGTVVDPKKVYYFAVSKLSSSLILVHNHPSGNKQPSEQDIAMTRKLKEAGSYFDIQVVDHVIIAGQGYYSFADDGKL